MNPDHDCSIGLCLHRSVEVEEKTVLTDAHILHGRIQLISKLRTGVSLLGGIVRVRPSGHTPPLFKYLFTDPRLFYHLVFGVAVPYQYRLVGRNTCLVLVFALDHNVFNIPSTGPGAWSGAREAILTVNERIAEPFKTNAAREKATSSWGLGRLNIKQVLAICIVLAAVYSAILTFIFCKLFF